MKSIKKLGALLLALVMIMALSTAVFADNATLDGGVYDNTHNTATAGENSVVILKELVLYNTDGKSIYLPTVDYSYTIAEAGESDGVGTTIKDAQGIPGTVYADSATTNGRALQTTSATVSFAPTTTSGYTAAGAAATITQPIEALAAGSSVYGGFTVSFVPANFDHAGVYRYKITESSANRTTAGVTTGTNSNAVRYLDVYVRGIDTDSDNVNDRYAIYGYVCFTSAATPIDGTSSSTVAAAKKTNGYVHGETLADVADQYFTKNLEVKKSFGAAVLNETGHQFPFTLTFTSGANGSGAWLNAADTTGAKTTGFVTEGTAVHSVLSNGAVLEAKLSKDQVVELYGIPTEAGASVKVKEQNDTYNVYALTATAANSSVTDTGLTGVVLGANVTSSDTAAIPVDGTAKTAITFTNNLSEISPTGLALRFAPYILMLGAGLFLLLLSRRRRSAEE